MPKMIALKSMSGDRVSIAVGSCFEIDAEQAKRLVISGAARPAKSTEKAIVNIGRTSYMDRRGGRKLVSKVKTVVSAVRKAAGKVTKKAAKKKAAKKAKKK